MQTPEPARALLEQARRLGPLPYSALGPHTGPDRLPDPRLIEWMVDAVDGWWAELGYPDPVTLVEVGAGDGTRAAAFLGSGPGCLTALRYVLVEDDSRLRHQHATHLPIESPVFVLGPVDGGGDDEEPVRSVSGIGPLVTSLGEPPVIEGPAVVVVIGWLSRQPSDRLEWREGAWWEVRLAAGQQPGAGLTELLVPADQLRSLATEAMVAGLGRPEGSRFAVLGPAVDWLARTLRVAGEGRLAVVDRWSRVTGVLAEREVPPLALDQLSAVRKPLGPAPEEIFPGISAVTWRLG